MILLTFHHLTLFITTMAMVVSDDVDQHVVLVTETEQPGTRRLKLWQLPKPFLEQEMWSGLPPSQFYQFHSQKDLSFPHPQPLQFAPQNHDIDCCAEIKIR